MKDKPPSIMSSYGEGGHATNEIKKPSKVKTFLVSGVAFVPVKVRFEVKAKNASKAIIDANIRFKVYPEIRYYSIVVGSEDYGAVHSFDCTNAEQKWLFSMNGQMQTVCVHVEFARSLEKALNEANAKVAELQKEPRRKD